MPDDEIGGPDECDDLKRGDLTEGEPAEVSSLRDFLSTSRHLHIEIEETLRIRDSIALGQVLGYDEDVAYEKWLSRRTKFVCVPLFVAIGLTCFGTATWMFTRLPGISEWYVIVALTFPACFLVIISLVSLVIAIAVPVMQPAQAIQAMKLLLGAIQYLRGGNFFK